MAALLMVIGYSLCHAACNFQQQQQLSGQLLVPTENSMATPVTQLSAAGSTRASSFIHTTTSGEYFISAFMVMVLLHKLYNRCVGPREIGEAAERACRTRGRRRISESQQSSCSSLRRSADAASVDARFACTPTAAGTVARPWSTPEAAMADEQYHAKRQQQQQQQWDSPMCSKMGQPAVSRPFLLKLAVVRLSNAAFVALYSWQVAQPGVQPETDFWDVKGLLHNPGLVGFLCALALVVNVLSCWLLQKRIGRYMPLLNSASVYVCLLCRLTLIWLLRSQGGILDAAATRLPAAELVPTKHAFHSFLMLAFSLVANEDPLPYFTAQLLGMALLYRALHLHLTVILQPPQPFANLWKTSLLDLPEYLVASTLLVSVYKWLCVGRYISERGGQGSAKAPAAADEAGPWCSSSQSSRTSSITPNCCGSKQEAEQRGSRNVAGAALQAGAAVAGVSSSWRPGPNGCGPYVQRQVSFSPSPKSCPRAHMPASGSPLPSIPTLSHRARRFSAPITHYPGLASNRLDSGRPVYAQLKCQQQSSAPFLDFPSGHRNWKQPDDVHIPEEPGTPMHQGCPLSSTPWRHPSVDLRAFTRTSFELPLPIDPEAACNAASLAAAAVTGVSAVLSGESTDPRGAEGGVQCLQGILQQGSKAVCVPEQGPISNRRAEVHTPPRPVSASGRSSWVSKLDGCITQCGILHSLLWMYCWLKWQVVIQESRHTALPSNSAGFRAGFALKMQPYQVHGSVACMLCVVHSGSYTSILENVLLELQASYQQAGDQDTLKDRAKNLSFMYGNNCHKVSGASSPTSRTSSRASFEVALTWQQRPGGFAGLKSAHRRDSDADSSTSYRNRCSQGGGDWVLYGSGDELGRQQNRLRRVVSDISHMRDGCFLDEEQLQHSSQVRVGSWQQQRERGRPQHRRYPVGDATDSEGASEPESARGDGGLPKQPVVGSGVLVNLRGRASGLAYDRKKYHLLVRDLMLCLFELPVCTSKCYQGVQTALQPASKLGLVYCWILLAAATICFGSSLCHLVLLILRPRWAMSQRRKLWPLKLSISHPAILFAQMVALETCAQTLPLQGLMSLAAYWGLLDLSPRLFIAW
jgi:hypothetical protein